MMASMDITTYTTADLLSAIKSQQAIQKRNHPKTVAWQTASKALRPLFAEMARRYPKGTVGPAV